MPMADIIMHHYDPSPFAHKARLTMGLKGLAWKSVVIPMVMPKPDLMPLTGGYRKTPVMQIGANIYFDTGLIAAELERRKPDPTLFPWGGEGMAAALAGWADAALFGPAGNYGLALIADKLDPAFFADRAAMRGQQPPDLEKFKAAAPRLKTQAELQIRVVESMVADGRPFLLGDRPGLADFSVYHPLWMILNSGRRAAAILGPFAATRAWMERVEAIGQGERTELDAKAALDVARDAEPEIPSDDFADEGAPARGTKVSLQPEDRTSDPVEGEVVLVRENEIAVRRHDPQVGEVVVHAPRRGFTIRPV